MTQTVTGYLDFAGPEGLRTRGTVLIVPGRGETTDTYRRFGRRIASDSYQVRVLPELTWAGSAEEVQQQLSGALAQALDGLPEDLLRPLILVGADVAAAGLSALAAGDSTTAVWWPDALVLAALPGYGTHEVGGDWEAELDIRTSCPAHRGVLTQDEAVHRGSLTDAVDDQLLAVAYGSAASVPQLLLVGDSDPLADRELLVRAVKELPAARLSVVHSAHHDVLNDLQHRSVAAEVITFLEVVRNGTSLQPIVTRESSTW